MFSERATTPFFPLMMLFSSSSKTIEEQKEKKKQESLSLLPQSLRNTISFGWKNKTNMLLLSVGKFKVAYKDYLKNIFRPSHICYYDSKDYICLLSYLKVENLCKSTFLVLRGKIDLHFSSVMPLKFIENVATM